MDQSGLLGYGPVSENDGGRRDVAQGGMAHRLLAAISGRINRHSDAIIALGLQMKEKLVAPGAAEQRVTVVHNWVLR